MKNFNILIIEDESLIALELADTISTLGYNVIEYTSQYNVAQQCIQNNKVDLILMDINLGKGLNGIELYEKLECNVPLIYLTAYNDEKTISLAIETNPLGYLIKPHKEDELKALLQLAYYKLQAKPIEKVKRSDLIRLSSEYHFDNIEEKLYFNDVIINLGRKELQLLKLLIEAKESVVSFKHIEDELWRDDVVSTSTMRTLIYRLRGKLRYKHIESIYNQGLKLTQGL